MGLPPLHCVSVRAHSMLHHEAKYGYIIIIVIIIIKIITIVNYDYYCCYKYY